MHTLLGRNLSTNNFFCGKNRGWLGYGNVHSCRENCFEPFHKSQTNSKIAKAPEYATLSAQVLVNVAKSLSTVSITDGQPSEAFCVCDRLLPCSACMHTLPSSSGPPLRCTSSNYTHAPFHVAAPHRAPSWAYTQNKPAGLRLPQTTLPIHSYSSCKERPLL